MGIDVAAARADTEGTGHVTHLDHAGSSLMPRPVVDTVVGHLRREEQIGGYAAAAESAERLTGLYSSLARLIGASAGELAVLESGSTAWSAAVSGLPLAAPRVLLARTEYWHNVLVLNRLARRDGLTLVVLDDDAHGQVDLAHLRRELDTGDVGLVVLTNVPMGGAQVQPAADVGRACRVAGVPFVLDACQSAGQLPLDVDALGCDVLVGTGRKFLRGPRGTAFVYLRQALLQKLQPSLRDRNPWASEAEDVQARWLESWESSVAARLGLGRAVDYALELGLEPIRERIAGLARHLRDRLAAVPGVQVHDRGLTQCGIVTFTVEGRTAAEVTTALAAHRITVSAVPLPPATAVQTLHPTGSGEPDKPGSGQKFAVRASVHYLTTEEEIDRLVGALR